MVSARVSGRAVRSCPANRTFLDSSWGLRSANGGSASRRQRRCQPWQHTDGMVLAPDGLVVAIARRLPAPEPDGYRRRRPEERELHKAVREHMATFLELVDSDPSRGELPVHVRGELERFLRCGILAHGFVRVRCSTCEDDLLVAFSCKGRGICPSCGGRRMADTAARWVDRVLPEVPWRQWVLTVPSSLRLSLAWDPELLTEILSIFQRAIACRLRLLARRKGYWSTGGRHASVTAIQRFGSALNLNVHIHSLVAEGVWLGGESGPPVFVPVCVRDADVAAVVRKVDKRVLALMLERGLLGEVDDEYLPAAPEVEPDQQLALDLLQASATLRIATGPRRGRLVRRVGSQTLARRLESDERRRPMQARCGGFDLHARVRVAKEQRGRLEKLGRYLLRPAICLERLQLRGDGLFQYDFRRPWSDGTTGIVLEPLELMEKLAALVPIPRANLVRYHGILAPAAAWRNAVVPRPIGEDESCPHAPPGGLVPGARVPWAQLLRRTFLVDVLRCARCGGKRELIAEVTDPVAIRAILSHLGLDPDDFAPVPARAPPGFDMDEAS